MMTKPILEAEIALAEITEIADAPVFGSPYVITVGDTFLGGLSTAGDRDGVNISLTAGTTYVFSVEGLTLNDTYLRLYDSAGAQVAFNDDYNGLDSQIEFTAATTGTYTISIGAYADLGAGTYRLFTSAFEPDTIPDTTATTASMTVGSTFDSAIFASGDHDWVAVTLTAGQVYSLEMRGVTLGDSFLSLYDSAGNLLTSNDDGGRFGDSQITFLAGYTGTYYLDAGAADELETGTYQLAASILPTFTTEEIAEQLTDGYWESSSRSRRAFDISTDSEIFVNITALTADGQALAQAALEAWSFVSRLEFTYVTTGGQIVFDDNQSGAFSTSTTTGNTIISSEVNVSTNWLASYGTTIDSYSFQTYVHEIGHALGLGHAGNYNGSATYNVDNDYVNDSWQATIMSYFAQDENTEVNADYAYIVTPMVADILAVQDLYGVPTTLRAGNTIYGENSTAGGYYDTLGSMTNPVALTIFDSGGIDTLDLRSDIFNQVIDLTPGMFSTTYGLTGNLGIATNTILENVVAGSGNDSVIGNAAANQLIGNHGNDTLLGEDGNDLLGGGLGADSVDGGLGNDSVYGADGNDVLVGGYGRDALYGGADNDLLGGGNGNDRLDGGAGNDRLYGANQNDTLIGRSGDDVLVGGFGRDIMNGGAGADVFDFNATGESTTALRDTIQDFNSGQSDKIDLATIDANTTVGGNQTFSFIGAAAFSAAGQLRFVTNGTDGFVIADVDGNGSTDFALRLLGVTTMDAADFIL